MRVLLVNDYAVPVGGAEALFLLLRSELRERGHEVRLFCSRARPDGSTPLSDADGFGTTSRLRTLVQCFNPGAALSLRRELRRYRPDVVHVGMFLTQLSPAILPVLSGYASVYHIQWHRPMCPLGTKMKPDGRLCADRWGRACRRARCLPRRDWLLLMSQLRMLDAWRDTFDVLVTTSDAMRDRVAAEGWDPPEVVWNGVPAVPQRPPLADPPTIGFAGRFVPEKGPHLAVQALAALSVRFPNTRLVMVGDGPERRRLQNLAAENGLSDRITWCGRLSREEMEARLSTAWAQLVPSRWEEPFGLVAAEAAMRGTAVVASRCGALPEVVLEGVTGLLFPRDDIEALAACLSRLLDGRDLAERLGAGGRARALARFGMDTFVDRMTEIYRLARHRHGQRSSRRVGGSGANRCLA